ncbi:MAG: acid phosphatase, partial [Pseudomonadota bacterium]
MSKRLFLAGLVAVAAMGSAVAAIGDPWMPPVDGVRILSAPPAAGSARDIADRAIFQATRALQGSPRWQIAQRDVENGPLSRYACALGVTLKASDVPILASLFDRAGAGFLVEPVKTHYARARPYADNDAPMCQARTAALARSGD